MASLLEKKARLIPLFIAAFGISMGILSYSVGIPFLDHMELKTIDLRFKSRGSIPESQKVVLAVIDEKSIAKEGKWIWPRSKIADFVINASEAGAKVIAFDIGFLEPDDKRIVRTIENIQRLIQKMGADNKTIKKHLENLKIQADNDRRLADAIKNSSAKVVLGYFFQMDPKILEHINEREIYIQEKNAASSAYKTVRYASNRAQSVDLIEAVVPQSNIEMVANATDYSGFFNMYPDPDGVVRWMPAVIKFKDNIYAPLSLMTVSSFLDTSLKVKVAEYGIEEINIGDLSVPVDELGRILINYRGKEMTFPHIPITDILNKNIPDNAFKDKIVMVGATAVGIYDVRVTPFGNVFPGLEIHANIVDCVLSKDFMKKPAWGAIFDIMAIIISGLVLGIVLPRTGVISGAVTASLLVIFFILMCHYLFSAGGWVLNLVYPLSFIIIIYISITVYRYFSETRQKRFIKNAFSTYLAPAVVKQLIESPDKFVLGGEERVITAFFSDIQGFTSISERLTPGELVELLNEFLTEMTDIILRHEGTVDKFEGDAIIAFFGAPNDLENQAEVACMSCIDMQKRLHELRVKWHAEKKPELKMRIGLCTGSAVVGNMGSKSRMDYTMMGDTVNTAARLEGVNKIYGIYTLISETTYKAAGDWIMAREIDWINVVGKNEPVKIYQLLGYPEDIDESLRKTVDLYAKGLSAYRDQDWNSAIISFLNALKITPGDGPSKTLVKRCDEYKKNPPGKDWDGSFSMTTK